MTADKYPDFNCYSIPDNLTPAQGTKGHFSRIIWTQFQLPRIYQKLESSLIFSPIPEAPLYGKCRFIVMVHDLIPIRFPKLSSPLTHYFRYYIPQVLNQAQHIVCNSHSTAKDITQFYRIPESKITPIPLAYDASRFCPVSLETDRQDSPPYFLYLGRQDPYKNLLRLISAFAAIPDRKDYELWFAGPQDKRYTPSLQKLAEDLDVMHQIKFLDYVSYQDLPKIIGRAIASSFPQSLGRIWFSSFRSYGLRYARNYI